MENELLEAWKENKDNNKITMEMKISVKGKSNSQTL